MSKIKKEKNDINPSILMGMLIHQHAKKMRNEINGINIPENKKLIMKVYCDEIATFLFKIIYKKDKTFWDKRFKI